MSSDTQPKRGLTVSQLIERLQALKQPDAKVIVMTREADWHVTNTVKDVFNYGSFAEIEIIAT